MMNFSGLSAAGKLYTVDEKGWIISPSISHGCDQIKTLDIVR
jgi:hypothetical protein